MAFQNHASFADFLRGLVQAGTFGESASSMNFLLEERLPLTREDIFLSEKPGPALEGWDVPSWWQTFANHYASTVALPLNRSASIATFSSLNGLNHLAIESHQDVVRIESIKALYQRYPGDYDSPVDLAAELQCLVRSRHKGKDESWTEERNSRLASWLEELNRRRDARPAFAAPLGEVEHLLLKQDWATSLRNVLGLSHFGGSVSKPLPVVLCQYNLSRVERAAKKAKVSAWASVPTVLEAGGAGGPGAAFFPFPQKAAGSNPFGFGVTVNLAPEYPSDFNSELLHFRLDYALDDFRMVGELTDEATDAQLLAARQRHFDLLEPDFTYRMDVQNHE